MKKNLKPGDLVKVHSEYSDFPVYPGDELVSLYPGDDLKSQPFPARTGDLVVLLGDHFLETHYRVQHPIAGFCLVAKHRLRSL